MVEQRPTQAASGKISCMGAAKWDLVTIDGNTTVLGAFWGEALDLIELEREDGDRWVVYGTKERIRRLGLQRGEPRAGGIHLDLCCAVDEFEDEVNRLVELGATLIGDLRYEVYGAIANLADPQGNLFDLCAYNHE
jgi:predicted enzyme related to lactoylglutathione lyase